MKSRISLYNYKIFYFSCVIPNPNLKIDLRIDREMLYYREYEYDTCVSITTYAPS